MKNRIKYFFEGLFFASVKYLYILKKGKYFSRIIFEIFVILLGEKIFLEITSMLFSKNYSAYFKNTALIN